MRFRLVHLSGSLAGRVREVDAAETVLGQDPQAAEVVFGPEDRLVSRRHASLKEEDGLLILRDLDSTHGTFLDGHDIEEAELRHGDVFELGRGGPRVRLEIGETGTLQMPHAPEATPSPADAPLPPAPPRPGPDSRIRLTFLSGTREGSSLELGGAVLRIGRGAGAAVWTPNDPMVSAQHAKVVRLEDAYVVIDLESTNGTWLNGRRTDRAPLRDGDVLRLGTGGPELRVQVLAAERAAGRLAATVVIPHFAELARRTGQGVLLREVVLDGPSLTVGRAGDVGLLLDSPIVSRQHARFTVAEGGLEVQDLDSSNGTYVSGRRADDRTPVAAGDRVVIGPFELLVVAPASATGPLGTPQRREGALRLHLLDTRSRVRLDALGLSVAAGGRTILDDVSLSLPAGSFTAIIGPSGAGKSTLLSALNGARPADRGRVLLNGADLYRSFERLKSVLGYVPQEDIVHRELTVAQSLGYTARLRLPPDTTAAERRKRVADVLATLELTDHAQAPIHRLSGGQRKRVSIAAELLTEPSVLFLDEPTSGLDPGLEESLMLLLRELSYKGKTVVLVTHTLDNIQLCDAVVLLVDGRLAFFGPSGDARAHFAIDHMPALYGRLKEKAPEQWRAAFAGTEAHRQRIAEPLQAVAAEPFAGAPAAPSPGAGALRQLGVLTARYLATLLRDGRNLGLLLAQAPLVAGLIGLSLLYGPSDVAYSKPKNTILFLLALVAVWFGCSNAVRELVKERALYVRERMVNLRVLPYVLSKVVVLGTVALGPRPPGPGGHVAGRPHGDPDGAGRVGARGHPGPRDDAAAAPPDPAGPLHEPGRPDGHEGPRGAGGPRHARVVGVRPAAAGGPGAARAAGRRHPGGAARGRRAHPHDPPAVRADAPGGVSAVPVPRGGGDHVGGVPPRPPGRGAAARPWILAPRDRGCPRAHGLRGRAPRPHERAPAPRALTGVRPVTRAGGAPR
jgi:ABC-type multidrug transport system ATPase subunit/pSer/pThr/pTyr-binding forkhead associated (FHA) protein